MGLRIMCDMLQGFCQTLLLTCCLTCGWGLTYALFWYNCKLFGLRGGDEHRSLTREQFTIGRDEAGRFLRFSGRSSKNVQGGLKQRKVQFKDLKIYSRPELGERCVVDLFNHYFGFVPKEGPFEPEKRLQGCSMLAAQLLWGLWLELVGVLLAVPMLTQKEGLVNCTTWVMKSWVGA